MARSILEAANVILPTGNPCEGGCFDELGNQYEIPIYCVVPPTNLTFSSSDEEENEQEYTFISPTSLDKHITTAITNSITTDNTSMYSSSTEHLVPAPNSSKNPFPIIVRLSTDQDIHLTISSIEETIGSLLSRIFDYELSHISTDTHIFRLIYLGRILKDTMSIICENQEEVDVELTFSRKNAVIIAKDSIIQALVANKKQQQENK